MNHNNQHNDIEISKDLNVLFQKASGFTLRADEKIKGAENLKHFIDSYPTVPLVSSITPSPIPSPYLFNQIVLSPFGIFMKKSLVLVRSKRVLSGIIACLLIFTMLTGTAYAAENALPGDLLYPVKIHVIEPTETALARGDEGKAEVAVRHMENRLKEIEHLTASQSLSEEKSNEASALLEKGVTETVQSIGKLHASGKTEDAIVISSHFENILNNYKEKLIAASSTHVQKSKNAERFEDKVKKYMTASAIARIQLENTLNASSTIIQNRKNALGTLVQSNQQIGQIEKDVHVFLSTTTKDLVEKEEIVKTISEAKNAVFKGQSKIETGAYGSALPLFKNAEEDIKHAEKLLNNAKRNAQGNIQSNTHQTEQMHATTSASTTMSVDKTKEIQASSTIEATTSVTISGTSHTRNETNEERGQARTNSNAGESGGDNNPLPVSTPTTLPSTLLR